MEIIKATITDLELLLSFAERTFRVAYEAQNEPDRFNIYCQEAFAPETFQAEMMHPQSGFWLAWMEGQLAGYLKLNFDHHHPDLNSDKTTQIERIYIEPALQGRRLGEELLRFAGQQALQAQSEWLWLSVWQENPRAVQFYERCGYEIFGTDIFYLADDPQVDWAMKKRVVLP